MTKEELIATYRKLQSENETLNDELDRLSDCYVELENQLAEATNIINCDNNIKDIGWFKWKLQLDNLLTPELEKFIENYMKFNNIVRG